MVENYVRLFLQTLYRHRREGRYQLHAFVLMPEHVHLLLTPARGVTLEHAVQLIKGATSHALGQVLGPRREIWQRGFTDHRIRNDQDFLSHQSYIHQNPVEPGSWRMLSNTVTALPSPDSNSTAGPQRLKPNFQRASKLARVELVPFPISKAGERNLPPPTDELELRLHRSDSSGLVGLAKVALTAELSG